MPIELEELLKLIRADGIKTRERQTEMAKRLARLKQEMEREYAQDELQRGKG